MVGLQIRVTALDLKVITVNRAADLVGEPENEVVAIDVGITEGATGDIMLVYPLPVAFLAWLI